jgi:hypothetical protein
VVAVGNLGLVWLDMPEFDSMDTLKYAFKVYFNADWDVAMVGADKPFGYHAAYDAYFAVWNFRPVNDMTVDQLLAAKDIKQPLNVVAG